MARDEGSGGAFAAFLIGAIAGAAVALLFAPAPGDETRRKLAEKARDGREHANRAYARGRDAFEKARRDAGATAGDAL
ncbi:MAG: YtxH domain-containing protein [Acidobacteriota bacterium]|nr:YtxH domain-containing protein [Acidobacteriota bacterium]MDQ3170991.1 YtxH domain-containing protein [Acidobacteriota bacterium]